MKLYLDEDLSPKIAVAMRACGVDTTSAHEAGHIQLTDAEQLQYAASEGRCLVTRNARHFIRLAKEAISSQEPHAGIVLCSPRFTGAGFRQLASALCKLADAYPDGLGPYDVLYL